MARRLPATMLLEVQARAPRAAGGRTCTGRLLQGASATAWQLVCFCSSLHAVLVVLLSFADALPAGTARTIAPGLAFCCLLPNSIIPLRPPLNQPPVEHAQRPSEPGERVPRPPGQPGAARCC